MLQVGTVCSMDATLRVVVVEPAPLLRSALAAVLEPVPPLSVVAQTAKLEGLSGVTEGQVVVVGPNIDGDDISRAASEASLVVVRSATPVVPVRALAQAGVSAVVSWWDESSLLVDAVLAVGAGRSFWSGAAGDALSAPLDSGSMAGLTSRELEVLELVSLGRSNREVADELSVSIQTVKTHLQRMYRKLGVGNRVQALCEAQRLGLT